MEQGLNFSCYLIRKCIYISLASWRDYSQKKAVNRQSSYWILLQWASAYDISVAPAAAYHWCNCSCLQLLLLTTFLSLSEVDLVAFISVPTSSVFIIIYQYLCSIISPPIESKKLGFKCTYKIGMTNTLEVEVHFSYNFIMQFVKKKSWHLKLIFKG